MDSLTGMYSHSRAWDLFEESIRDDSKFESIKCADYGSMVSGKFETKTANMGGEPGNSGLSGVFYLQTNSSSPFGKGKITSYLKRK